MLKTPLIIDPEDPPYNVYKGLDFEKFWDGLQKLKMDELEHAIVSDLLPVSGRRIIDVGCGFGRLADCYMGRFQQVIMFDASMSLLHQAFDKTGGKGIYIAGDVMHLPFRPATFDTALVIRIFHRISDERTFLSKLHKILCDNGSFIFSYRNKCNAIRIARWLIRRSAENPFTMQPSGVRYPWSTISHHPKAVHRMLHEAGFNDIRYYGAGVCDWFAARLGSFGGWIPPGRRLARLFGITKIAPWILSGSIAEGKSNQIDALSIDDLLQCPSCEGAISEEELGYRCQMCGRQYTNQDGIIDMRL